MISHSTMFFGQCFITLWGSRYSEMLPAVKAAAVGVDVFGGCWCRQTATADVAAVLRLLLLR